MKANNLIEPTNRRRFIGSIASGAAAIGVSAVAPTLKVFGQENSSDGFNSEDPEEIFKKLNGKHKIVFDVIQPHEIFPFAWPRVFLMSNEMTGTKDKDCSVVVILRHKSIGYAMEDRLWEKYKLGEFFKANDPETGQPAIRNPFWKPKPGAFKVPAIGEVFIGIDQLQSNGVIFCVCEMALKVQSAAVAQKMNLNAEDVRNDFIKGLLPDIQKVPSGVWALGRAQERGCGYIFAG